MLGHLETACDVLRARALAAGIIVERLKIENAKMRQIYAAEREHKIAWQRVYAIEMQLREAA